jgi:enoyl-CoA hydratase/carnithine racemase
VARGDARRDGERGARALGQRCRVAIVCGNERAFSAGEDVRGMAGLADVSTKRFRSVAREFHDVFDEIGRSRCR